MSALIDRDQRFTPPWVLDVVRQFDEIHCDPCTSTVAVRRLLRNANALAFWHKRIAFLKPDGTYEAGAKFASMSAYFGERAGRFNRVFSPHATVLFLR